MLGGNVAGEEKNKGLVFCAKKLRFYCKPFTSQLNFKIWIGEGRKMDTGKPTLILLSITRKQNPTLSLVLSKTRDINTNKKIRKM